MRRVTSIILAARAVVIAAFLLFSLQDAVFAHNEPSGDDTALLAKLDEYLKALDSLDEKGACEEVDFIISIVQDEELRSQVGERCYRHFRESKIMGSENVAVYIYDRWFADCTLIFQNIDDFEEAGVHAYVNRASLIGADARELTLTDQKGKEITFPRKGRAAVLFFYSATCPKCLYTASQLQDYFARKGVYSNLPRKRLRINVYNIYAGGDDLEWDEYVQKNLKFVRRCGLKVYNLKGDDSEYITSYGVVQTPRLFLVSKKGKIAGRNLDVPALKFLLEHGL